MSISTFLVISVVVALLGTMIGAATVVVQKRQTSTDKPQRTVVSPTRTRPSRKQIFLPMISLLGLSIFLLLIGYTTANFIAFAVGFLILFLGFGLLGSFLFNKLF